MSPFFSINLNRFRIIIEAEVESPMGILELRREIQAGRLDTIDLKNAKVTVERLIECEHDFSGEFQEEGGKDDKNYKVCKYCGEPKPDET